MPACRVCGTNPRLDIIPSQLRDLRALLGPRWRATVGGLREMLCFRCAMWAARFFGVIA
jgi:hypothetical protein